MRNTGNIRHQFDTNKVLMWITFVLIFRLQSSVIYMSKSTQIYFSFSYSRVSESTDLKVTARRETRIENVSVLQAGMKKITSKRYFHLWEATNHIVYQKAFVTSSPVCRQHIWLLFLVLLQTDIWPESSQRVYAGWHDTGSLFW